MIEFLIGFVQDFPKPFATLILASLPILEIRGALPVGILVWNVDWLVAYLFALVGNLLPVIPLLFGLAVVRDTLFKLWPALGEKFTAWEARANKKMQGHYLQYGAWAVFLFTAIPFPFTGAYTASVASVSLNIPFRKAFPALFCGICVSGLITLLLIFAGSSITR